MVLGGFGEAKILNFRMFFDVFSKPKLSCVSDGPKIAKKHAKSTADAQLMHFWGGVPVGGRLLGRTKEGL